MKSNKQKIILVDDKGCVHELNSTDELNTWIRAENKARETLFLPTLDCNNLKVFVGEKRCLKAIPGRATTQYQLSDAGCGCSSEPKIKVEFTNVPSGVLKL